MAVSDHLRPLVTVADRAVIARQLGRPPRDLTGVAVRCPFGWPVVIETAPVLSDGTPNPTLLYLTCPVLTAAVSRLEAGGGVRDFKERCRDDVALVESLAEVTRLYQARRALLLTGAGCGVATGDGSTRSDAEAVGSGEDAVRRCLGGDARLGAGIGGPVGPEKASCLHAYAAALLAVRAGWFAYGAVGQGASVGKTAVAGVIATGEAAAEAEELAGEAERIWVDIYSPLGDLWCCDDRCGACLTRQRRAVIDVGTISVRLLVADVAGERMEAVERRVEITRLGEGLLPGGRLRAEAAERTSAVVHRFVDEAQRLGASSLVVVGTSAVREAADGRKWLMDWGRRSGVRAAVLSPREEAEMGYTGATLDIGGGPVVIDVGGGSTEVSRRAGIRFETVSLDIGAAKATERWIATDPPAKVDLDRVRRDAEQLFAPLTASFRGDGRSGAFLTVGEAGIPRLVGVAGTVTTLACLAGGLERYDRDILHLSVLSRGDVQTQLDRLSTMTTAEREALPCMQPGRAAVIVGGSIIVLAAMDVLGFSELTVSERDLLDGLIVHGPW
ncbi:MAG: DUF501 domain-containing protein [Thermoleophilia bacterium]